MHAGIQFVTREQFESLSSQNIDPANEVGSPYQPKNTVIKSGAREELDPTYSKKAVECIAGLFLVNGAELHSHIAFHLNCRRNMDSASKGFNALLDHFNTLIGRADRVTTYIDTEFREQVDAFFENLNSLVASHPNEKKLSLNLILTGGLQSSDYKWKDRVPLRGSPRLRKKLENLFEDSIRKQGTQLASQGLELSHKTHIFWGQKIKKIDGSPSVPASDFHYDPATNIVSLTARRWGHGYFIESGKVIQGTSHQGDYQPRNHYHIVSTDD